MTDVGSAQILRRRRVLREIARWILAALGVPILCAGWLWLALASTEQAEESAKAPLGDTSTEGLFVMFGVVPLVIAHLLGVVILRAVAPGVPGRRGGRWLVAATLVVVASGIGLAVAITLNGGVLLTPVGGNFVP